MAIYPPGDSALFLLFNRVSSSAREKGGLLLAVLKDHYEMVNFKPDAYRLNLYLFDFHCQGTATVSTYPEYPSRTGLFNDNADLRRTYPRHVGSRRTGLASIVANARIDLLWVLASSLHSLAV